MLTSLKHAPTLSESTDNIELDIVDQRMLDLMEYCVATRYQGIASKGEWCRIIGIRVQYMDNIKKGTRKFTRDQLAAAGRKIGANMNFLYGLSSEVLRKDKRTPLEMLQEAVKAIETEYGKPRSGKF